MSISSVVDCCGRSNVESFWSSPVVVVVVGCYVLRALCGSRVIGPLCEQEKNFGGGCQKLGAAFVSLWFERTWSVGAADADATFLYGSK